MARGKQQDVREFFGELLKERREAAGLTQGELGRRVFVSGGYMGLFEQGIRKPQLDVAMRIDEVLQTGGIFERTWRKLINKSPYASYFQAAAALEDIATKICEFEAAAVPGLDGVTGFAPVRDGRNPTGPVLVVAAAAWSTFVGSALKS
ncbi:MULTISPECIES: helix-turn-helix domain-containing protein [unclassified Streptomyces]|uniref:helix-turn-helix domain-containing protein n=1 Tax=unclassified Streptomyces TaxID=2593676 RepID=UPI0016565BD1|nr:helix-turn-helix domain-containing protein [Streptomyces sp. CB02980]MCB8905412.1 helix-turn-helix domain-containing protein [Streptomyces sp. CB02980]